MPDEGALTYVRVCTLDDVWEGEMQTFTVEGTEVLIVAGAEGQVSAFHPLCPHQDYPLIEGELEDGILTCTMHRWRFDAATGAGVNPKRCQLKRYPAKVEGDTVYVDLSDAG